MSETGPTRGRRIRRATAWVAAALLALALLTVVARRPLVGFALQRIAAHSGYTLAIERVDYDSIDRLHLTGIHLTPRGGASALVAAQVADAHIEFRPLSVLTRGIGGVRSLAGSGLTVRVDLGHSPPPRAGQPSALAAWSALARELPSTRIEGVELELHTSTGDALRAHGGALRIDAGAIEYTTPIDALDGHARARITLAHGRLTAHVDAHDLAWSGRRIGWARGEIRLDADGLSLRDVWIGDGASTLEIPYLDLPTPAFDPCTLRTSARGAFRFESEEFAALLEKGAPQSALEALPAHRLELSGRIEGGFLELGPGRLDVPRGHIVLERGSAPLADTLRAIASDPALDLALSADFEDVGALGALLGPLAGSETWSGRLEGEIRVRGDVHGPIGRGEIFAAGLRIFGQRIDWLSARAEIDAARISVTHLEATTPNVELTARGAYRPSDGRFDGVELSARVRDIGRFEVDDLTGGPLDLSLSAAGTWPAIEGTLTARATDIVWRGRGPAEARIDVRATADGPLGVRAAVDLECDHVDVSAVIDRPDASGVWRARIDELFCSDGATTLGLARPCTVRATGSSLDIAGLHLASRTGDVRLDVKVAPGAGDVRARVVGFDPRALIELLGAPLPSSHLDGQLDAHWEFGAIAAGFDVRCSGLELERDVPAIDIEAVGALRDGRLSIERLEASAAGDPVLSFVGALPFDPLGSTLVPEGPVEARGSLALRDATRLPPALQERTGLRAGILFADVALSGTTQAPRGRIVLGGEDVVWTRDVTLGPWSFAGSLELGDVLAVRDLSIEFGHDARATIDGTIGDLAGVLRGLHTGALPEDAPLHVDVALGALDLATFGRASTARVRRAGGSLTGGLTLRGTLGDPVIAGRVALEHGELRTTTALPSIQGLEASLSFDGDRVTIENVRGEMGGARFRLAGTYTPRGAERGAALTLSGENLLLYRQAGLSVRADAALTIQGPLEALAIGGRVELTNSRFTRDLDLLALPKTSRRGALVRGIELFSLTEAPFADARFDVSVTSKAAVAIRNNRIQGGLRPDLRLTGTGRLPVLLGSIRVEPTRVRLPASTLYVRSGRIEFRPDDPFVPVLDVTGEARLRGYDISIGVTGAYDEPVVSLASAPPLAREDLLLLVLTGRAPGAKAGSLTDLDAAREVVVFLAGDTVGSLFSSGGDDFDEASSEERFDLQTGQDVTQKGAQTMRASLLLGRGLTRRNDALYATGERDIYDRYNYGLRLVFRFP